MDTFRGHYSAYSRPEMYWTFFFRGQLAKILKKKQEEGLGDVGEGRPDD